MYRHIRCVVVPNLLEHAGQELYSSTVQIMPFAQFILGRRITLNHLGEGACVHEIRVRHVLESIAFRQLQTNRILSLNALQSERADLGDRLQRQRICRHLEQNESHVRL